ncbi:hypothetical protein V6N13_105060 [Hibiscus sabdariffa]
MVFVPLQLQLQLRITSLACKTPFLLKRPSGSVASQGAPKQPPSQPPFPFAVLARPNKGADTIAFITQLELDSGHCESGPN